MTLVYALDHRHAPASQEDLTALVGGKAANLGVMARDLELPVPPGFVITTEACRRVLEGDWPAELEGELREAMARVEERVGRRFGDPADPLLVSVRSGAPVSMPGMMDTILDIGVTSATTRGLAAVGGDAFAADCRRRLGAMFRDVVAGGDPPDDPWLQLRQAITAVFRSWNSDRAHAYRAREAISEDMGTAVTVQAMVFGNRDARSATGVLFTRNPATGEPTPYGDVVFGAQGEDVVAGSHATEPIVVLDERMPEVAAELRDHARRLEHHFADLCDIEFTIESGRLWLLQVRVGKRTPEAALRLAVDMAEDPAFPLTRDAAVRRVGALLDAPTRTVRRRGASHPPLLVGLAASPGIASGPIVMSPQAAEKLAEEGRPGILVREETSPQDVPGMARAAGIITARGGIASHAAVVARGWGIPAVVGAAGLRILGDGIDASGTRLSAGDTITIDGGTGEVFRGVLETVDEPIAAAQTLRAWAAELGVDVGAGTPSAAEPSGVDLAAPLDTGSGTTDPDACVRAIGIKGVATADALASAVPGRPADITAALSDLVDRGLVAVSGGGYRLTGAGTQRLGELVADERATIGTDAAEAILDELLALDRDVKEVVTAWQLRASTAAAEPVLNDHTDPDYDASVLARLERLALEADSWLASVERRSPRIGRYRARLAAATQAAANGDTRYVASPRVDSFHGAWFELHEDLILLAGRTREEEIAAGRA